MKNKSKSKPQFFKKIRVMLNLPLIIFLLIVGGLLLIANMKSEPVVTVKEKVSKTVNNVSKNLNEAAKNGDDTKS